MIGASRKPGKIGHELFRNLLEYGFEGPVYPVHPSAVSVAGVRAYPSVEDVPDAVDLAVDRRARSRTFPRSPASARRRACAGCSSSPPVSRRPARDGKAAERELVAFAPAQRHAHHRPELLRRVEHRGRGADERDVCAGATGRGQRCVPVAVGRARDRADEPGRRPRDRHLAVRLGRQQGRRQRQRPLAVLGRRRADRSDPPLPRVVREPRQVRPPRRAMSPARNRSSR